jgi:hypothetical protein
LQIVLASRIITGLFGRGGADGRQAPMIPSKLKRNLLS